MSHPSKVKGNGFERELVKDAQERGMHAERAYGSDGRALGLTSEVDVIVGRYRFDRETKAVQAKRRKKLPEYLRIPRGCDAVVFRQDRGPKMVLLEWEAYLDLLEHGGKTPF